MKYYFYSKKSRFLTTEKFTVYEVEAVKGNIDVADRRAKTLATQRKDKLAGGYFSEDCKPFNFKKDYTVIKVSLTTRVSSYTKADRMIFRLIEAESGR